MNKDVQEFENMFSDVEGALVASVLTINEVAAMWGKSRRTVEMAFWKGQIKGRQGKNSAAYLISRSSCVDNWGAPKIQFEDL